MVPTRSLDPLLVALWATWPRQVGRRPRRQKRQRRFLRFKHFPQALLVRRARGAMLHPRHQRLGFTRTRFDRFEALDELLRHDLGFFQTGVNRFEVLDEGWSHDGRSLDPVCGHDNG